MAKMYDCSDMIDVTFKISRLTWLLFGSIVQIAVLNE